MSLYFLPHPEGSERLGADVDVEEEAETEGAGVGSKLGGTWQKEYMIPLFAGSISCSSASRYLPAPHRAPESPLSCGKDQQAAGKSTQARFPSLYGSL